MNPMTEEEMRIELAVRHERMMVRAFLEEMAQREEKNPSFIKPDVPALLRYVGKLIDEGAHRSTSAKP